MEISFNNEWEKIHAERIKDKCVWGGYPCEEVIRFMARNYYNVENRANVKVCDMGCGSGANTWYLCNEGFDVHGFDGSASAIKQAESVINAHRMCANLKVKDALATDYEDEMFDVLIDNVSLCYMSEDKLKLFYKEAYRIAKAGAKMFTSGFTVNCTGVKNSEIIGDNTYTHFSEGNISSYDNVIHVWPDQKKVYDFFAETEWRVISLDTISWTDYGGKIKNEKYVVILQKG